MVYHWALQNIFCHIFNGPTQLFLLDIKFIEVICLTLLGFWLLDKSAESTIVKNFLFHLWAWHQLKQDDLTQNLSINWLRCLSHILIIVQWDIKYQKSGLTSYSNQKPKFLDKLALSFWHWVDPDEFTQKFKQQNNQREVKLSCARGRSNCPAAYYQKSGWNH